MNFETIKDLIIICGGKILIAIVFFIITNIVVKKVLSLIKDGFSYDFRAASLAVGLHYREAFQLTPLVIPRPFNFLILA